MDVSSSPVVAFYCATFLKPEMLHIYRQITALERICPLVIAQKRENPEGFPFDRVDIVPKPATHFLRRIWFRQLRDMPWQISSSELRALIRTLDHANAQLLHIFFGHIGVHLLPLIRAWPKPAIVSFHGADVLVDMDKVAYRTATKAMLDAVERVLVRSESLRHAVVDLGCDQKKIDVVRAGIPLDEFPFRERNFPQNGDWRFIQACRLIEKKGLATSLRAFATFLTRYPNATLTIAGEGPLLRELQTLTRELKIDNRVSFTGFISQEKLCEIFYASHIFLHGTVKGSVHSQPRAFLVSATSSTPSGLPCAAEVPALCGEPYPIVVRTAMIVGRSVWETASRIARSMASKSVLPSSTRSVFQPYAA